MTDEPTTSAKRGLPFSLRLMPEERLRLENDAAGMSMASYVRLRLFDPASAPPRRRGKFPVKDHQALSSALAKLGSSGIASNLDQLAKAANSGSLAISPGIEADLHEAIAEIASIRALLLDALGLTDVQ